ncbi:MAG: (deoxy)nucleoside triphosphate pyrophosphohydrolase [Phycisphaerae bacterium]|nr:(deoxy)nucleoside triphosphate pyrophosphohydrolase [Phycisphaerae bacterium]
MSASSRKTLLVAIAIVRRDARWLVARRHDHAHLGGLWEFPGGKIEPNETPEQAAVRELLEECGLHAAPRSRLPAVEFDYPERHVTVIPVRCEATAGRASAIGSAEVRWVSDDELRSLDMPAANSPILAALLDSASTETD